MSISMASIVSDIKNTSDFFLSLFPCMYIFFLWLVLRFFANSLCFSLDLCFLGFTVLSKHMYWYLQLVLEISVLSLYFLCPLSISSPWIPSTCVQDHLILSCRYKKLSPICPFSFIFTFGLYNFYWPVSSSWIPVLCPVCW